MRCLAHSNLVEASSALRGTSPCSACLLNYMPGHNLPHAVAGKASGAAQQRGLLTPAICRLLRAPPEVEGVVQETPVSASVSRTVALTLLCTVKLPEALLPSEHTASPAGPAMLPVGVATSVAEAAAVAVLLQPPSLWVAVRFAIQPVSGQPAPGRSQVTVKLVPAAAASMESEGCSAVTTVL